MLAFGACGEADRERLPALAGIEGADSLRRHAEAGTDSDRFAYARRLHAADAYGAAAEVYGRVVERLSGTERAEAAWLRALALHQAGLDPDAALEVARREAAKLPQVWRLSAERALDAGRFEDARAFAARALALDARDPGPSVLAARAWIAEGRLTEAGAAAAEALRKDPDDPAARHVAALVRLRSGDGTAAGILRGLPPRTADVVRDPVYRRVLLERNDVRAARLRAEATASAGDLAAARNFLLPFSASAADDVDFQLQLADLNFRLGDVAAADAAWARAASRDDASAAVLERRATRLLDLGAPTSEAAAVARRALAANPDSVGARLVLGACALRDGTPGEAVPYLREVRAARPEWELARRLLEDAERLASKPGTDRR